MTTGDLGNFSVPVLWYAGQRLTPPRVCWPGRRLSPRLREAAAFGWRRRSPRMEARTSAAERWARRSCCRNTRAGASAPGAPPMSFRRFLCDPSGVLTVWFSLHELTCLGGGRDRCFNDRPAQGEIAHRPQAAAEDHGRLHSRLAINPRPLGVRNHVLLSLPGRRKPTNPRRPHSRYVA